MGKMRNNEDESRKDKDAKSWMAWPGKVKSQGTHEIFESMYSFLGLIKIQTKTPCQL